MRKANMKTASIAWTGGETIDALTIAGNAYRIAFAQSSHEAGATRAACLWGRGYFNEILHKWFSTPNFFAVKKGMLGAPISVLGGWPTVSARFSRLPPCVTAFCK